MTDSQQQRYAAARRRVIEREYSKLNSMQRQAVLSTEGPLLLLAGAGSGKTTVLINRVANILRYGRGSDCTDLPAGVGAEELALLEAAAEGKQPVTEQVRALCAVEPPEPWRILAITFTNKAAGELKARLENVLGPEANDIWALTFHSACTRMLRRDADRLGFTRNFTIYDKADSEAVMKRVLKEMNVDEKVWAPRSMLSAASRYKGELISPEQAVAQEQKTGDIRRIRTAQICQAYAARLKEAGAMDFDDLLYYTVRLLQENADVLERYQRQFRYVLIDEYQDTNHLQYEFAAMIAGGMRNICVVGDDDQSIYKFRGATIENILSFEKQYKDARVIRLEQNYRSTGNILAAANAVIANNTERKGKNLWTDQGDGERLVMYIARSEDDEADFVARQILSSGRPARDHAILYRTNAQSRTIEQTLKRYRIDYRVYGGTRFFDRAEVKDILAYLCVIANPTDETRLLRIVNVPARGIGQTSLEKAQQLAREKDLPLFEVLRQASHHGISAGKRMEEFCAMIEEMQSLLAGNIPLDEFYDVLLARTGYVAALEAKNLDENLSRIENVHELKTSIIKSMEETGGDLYSFLDEVALYTDMDNYDRESDAAVMMTMHSAKGLEFPVVFIVGAEEGLFPGMMAIGEPGEMEEERRLCYVAITRARERLFITCAAQRMLYGRTSSNLPSRFTEEIPANLVERRGVARRERQTEPFLQFGGGEAYFFGDRGYAGGRGNDSDYGSRSSGYGNSRTAPPAPRRPAVSPKAKSNLSAPTVPDFKVGDAVEHKAFGAGVIRKLTPMGGDALVEIAFDTAGEKKLMLRVAAQHMKKA